MNAYTEWFSRLVWIGILASLWYVVPALFVPEFVINVNGFDPEFETIWLRSTAGVLVFVIVYDAAVARDPVQNALFAWLIVIRRLIGAASWSAAIVFDIGSPGVVTVYLLGDLILGIGEGALLNLGLPHNRRLNLKNITKIVTLDRE